MMKTTTLMMLACLLVACVGTVDDVDYGVQRDEVVLGDWDPDGPALCNCHSDIPGNNCYYLRFYGPPDADGAIYRSACDVPEFIYSLECDQTVTVHTARGSYRTRSHRGNLPSAMWDSSWRGCQYALQVGAGLDLPRDTELVEYCYDPHTDPADHPWCTGYPLSLEQRDFSQYIEHTQD